VRVQGGISETSAPAARSRNIVALVALVLLVASGLRAEEPASVSPPSRAQELFDQALVQREAGAEREACELFEASVAAGPTPHGWLQVGRCREPVDIAGALEAYEAARALAGQVTDDMRRDAYLSAAGERIGALLQRVPTITFRASPTPALVAEVTQVGREVPSPVDRFDTALRFNPGRYQVRAWAKGFSSYTLELELGEGERRVVALPELQSSLEGVPAMAPSALSQSPASSALEPEGGEPFALPAPEAPPRVDASSGLVINPLPVVLSGGGLALVLSGIVVGQLSSSERHQLERECGGADPATGQRRCESALAGTRQRMSNLALASDVLWIGGALLAATGVGVFIHDQRDRAPDESARVVAGCGPSHCGLSAMGRF